MKVDFKTAGITCVLLLGGLLSWCYIGSIQQNSPQQREIRLQQEKKNEKRVCYVSGVGTYIKTTKVVYDHFDNGSNSDVYFITEEKDLPEGFSSLSDAEKQHISIQGTMISNGKITALRDIGQDGTIDHYMFHMSVSALKEKNMETTEKQRKYVQSMLEKILRTPNQICQTDDINIITNLFQ